MLTLHAGMPKTATTTLQLFLASHGSELAKHGVNYPLQWRDLEGIAHHELGKAMVSGSHSLIDKFAGEIEAYVATQSGRHTLISTEALTNACVAPQSGDLYELLIRLGRVVPVRFVLCLRRIDDFLESMYLHEAKVGEIQIPVEDYLAAREDWVRSFFETLSVLRYGRLASSVRLLAYDKSEDFLRKLASAIGVPAPLASQLMSTKFKNKRLGLKGQTVLLLLPALEEELGLRLPRERLISDLESGELLFDDDTLDYHVVPPLWAKFFHELALRMAIQTRVVEYHEAFGNMTLKNSAERRLERALLSAMDLNRLRTWVARQAATA